MKKEENIELPWMKVLRTMMEQNLDSDTIINRLLEYGESEEDRITEGFKGFVPDPLVLEKIDLSDDEIKEVE